VKLRKKHIVRLIITTLLFIKSNVLLSQTTFSETIDFNGNQESAYATIQYDNYIYLMGNGLLVDDGYKKGLFFCKTDLLGNVVWRRTFVDDSSTLSCGFNALVDQSGIIYITGGRTNESLDETNAFLCSLDPFTGDTLRFHEFNIPGFEAGLRIQWMPDSTILIFGTKTVSGYGKILLMNVDTLGNIIFNKYYGTGIVRNSRYFQLDDNGSISIAFGDEDCDPRGYTFHSVDILGNIESTNNADENCLEWGVPSLSDDGYYVAGYEYYIYTLTFLAKLNNDFSYSWKNYFEPDGVYLLWAQHELMDGSVIVYGSKLYEGASEHAFLRKIDASGNTIWEREYYTEQDLYPNYIWDISETAEGDLICVGTAFAEPLMENGFLSQNFWLLRLDSLGCIEAGCDTINIENPPQIVNFPTISIYPNPLINEGTIQINLDLVDINNVTYFEIELRDIAGHILEEFTIDQFHWKISNNKINIPFTRGTYSSGIYFIEIKTTNKIIGNMKVLLF